MGPLCPCLVGKGGITFRYYVIRFKKACVRSKKGGTLNSNSKLLTPIISLLDYCLLLEPNIFNVVKGCSFLDY